MRLSRVSLTDAENPAATDLIAKGDLDLLQLDFAPSSPDTYADGFLQQLRSIHKFFFLEPKLRLVTNAGGANVTACVEMLGEYLREHGDANMPITAVRGDNILPRLPELQSLGIPLMDELTGEQLAVGLSSVESAQVQLGAGPLATALTEESRMIVSGCHDRTAPFLAAGVAMSGLAWDDYDSLARLACAAEVSPQFSLVTEVNAGRIVAIQRHPAGPLDEVSIRQALNSSAIDKTLRTADVVCNASTLKLIVHEDQTYGISQVTGSVADDRWRVRVVLKGESGQQDVRWSSVPRDAIPLSVDTRPASEWL